jgi:hypothetical protein
MNPKELIAEIEQNPALPDGDRERFRGYGVMGLPFSSGHILGLRRWPASSIGPGYASAWHRDPDGRWTFYTDIDPQISCNRYFSAAIDWSGPNDFQVTTGDGAIAWSVTIDATPISRIFTAICSNLPDKLWDQEVMLRTMGTVGGRMLRAGSMILTGLTPNQQIFKANPLRIWTVPKSRAIIEGTDLGEVGPIPEQAQLGDFCFPQRGLFVVAQSFVEQFDPERHLDRIVKSTAGILQYKLIEVTTTGT